MTQSNSNQIGYIFGIGLVAAITGLLMGFDTGIISGALQFIVSHFHIAKHDHFLQEIIVSAVPIGALVGAVMSKFSSRHYGRRNTLLITAILFIGGTLVTVVATSVTFVIIGRLLMGFAVGLSAMAAPMYLSEIAPQQVRGAIVFLFQLAITVGLMSAFIINYIFAATGAWRDMFAIGLAPALLLGIGILFLPKSPRWLLLNGDEQAAIDSLKKLRATDDISHELNDIRESIKHQQVPFMALFNKRLFPLVIITFGLFVFQQFTGINTIFYYAPTIFSNAGFAGNAGAILASISTGLVNVIATIFGVILIDKVGRRKLLLNGCAIMTVCLALIGFGYLGLFGNHLHLFTLLLVLVFIAAFAVSLGGIPYVMMAELFPLNARSSGMALASCANWGFNILVSSTFLTLVYVLGIGTTFILYAALTLMSLFFVWRFVPETKNVSLEKIEANLYNNKPLRKLGDH